MFRGHSTSQGDRREKKHKEIPTVQRIGLGMNSAQIQSSISWIERTIAYGDWLRTVIVGGGERAMEQ